MEINKIQSSETTLLVLSGSINKVDIPGLRKAIGRPGRSNALRFDLSRVDFINSGFIGLLLELRKSTPAEWKEIRIQNPAGMVRDVLFLTGLNKYFKIENAETVERRS